MLSDYETLVASLVRDTDSQLSTSQIQNAIALAVYEYSKRKPDKKVQDVTGDGTRLLPLPAAWQDDFSHIRTIEYPIGDVPPTLLEGYSLYESPGATQILLKSAVASGENARVTFTIRHQVDAVTDTITIDDREAVASYAAALGCQQLASLYSGDQDSTIQSDSVDHQGKASRYSSRARELRARFYQQLGIDPKKNVAAGVEVNLDLDDSLGGDRLTHSKRFR